VFDVENIIRWKYSSEMPSPASKTHWKTVNESMMFEQKEAKKMVSNAKIVKWSDGTFQMAIGDEFFNIGRDQALNSFVFDFQNE